MNGDFPNNNVNILPSNWKELYFEQNIANYDYFNHCQIYCVLLFPLTLLTSSELIKTNSQKVLLHNFYLLITNKHSPLKWIYCWYLCTVQLSGAVAYLPGKWQNFYIPSADIYFEIIIIDTQIINCLFYFFVQISIPSQLCLANAWPWFTNISKFYSIHNCEFVGCICIHTYIAHQNS